MDKRPNILWLCTDQQRWDTIHALGNPYIDTPHRTPILFAAASPDAVRDLVRAFFRDPDDQVQALIAGIPGSFCLSAPRKP